VATSRARALVVLVCNPALLTVSCKTPDQMRLANEMARFVELAGMVATEMAAGLPQGDPGGHFRA
jgi:hypothetical protein